MHIIYSERGSEVLAKPRAVHFFLEDNFGYQHLRDFPGWANSLCKLTAEGVCAAWNKPLGAYPPSFSSGKTWRKNQVRLANTGSPEKN